jgi:hypothetical protein
VSPGLKKSDLIDHGWISQLSGAAPVSLHDRLHARDPIDLHACWLQDEIVGVRKRFAMIVDATLRPRSIHTYGVGEQPPSPLDFVRPACRLRDEQERQEQAREPRAMSGRVTARLVTPRQFTWGGSAIA